MTRMQFEAISQRTEAALCMGASLADVYALAVAIEDFAEEAEPESKASADCDTVRPGVK